MARLAAALLPPFDISATEAKQRSVAAKQWLSSLSLPTPLRNTLAHVADSAATQNSTATAWAIEKLITATAGKIDEASAAELRSLMNDLNPPPSAPSPLG
jgi:hypothetical protein